MIERKEHGPLEIGVAEEEEEEKEKEKEEEEGGRELLEALLKRRTVTHHRKIPRNTEENG
jgi:hypothetical protein